MFLIESAVSVLVAYGLRPRDTTTTMVEFDSLFEAFTMTTEQMKAVTAKLPDTLETVLAKDFGSVDAVRYVFTEWAEGPLLVWIALDDAAPEVRQRIYAKELSLIEGFPEVEFDFNLIPSMGRPPEQICSAARVVYSKA